MQRYVILDLNLVIDESSDHSIVSLDTRPTVHKIGHTSQKAVPLRAQKVYELMEDTIFLLAGILNVDP